MTVFHARAPGDFKCYSSIYYYYYYLTDLNDDGFNILLTLTYTYGDHFMAREGERLKLLFVKWEITAGEEGRQLKITAGEEGRQLTITTGEEGRQLTITT